MLIISVLNILAWIFIAVAFYYCLYANINQGVIASLLTMSGLWGTMFAYILYKETISMCQAMGMTILIACCIIIGMAGDKPTADD